MLARQDRSQQVLIRKYSSQLNRGSSRRAAWRGADRPGRLSRRQARPASRTRQRRQLPANRAEPLITAGEATARQRASMLTRCRISAYPGIFSALMLETLSFVRVAILEDLEDATGRRARSRRVPVPWQACHEQAQRRSKQSQAWPCRGAVAGGLTGRASIALKICQSRSYFTGVFDRARLSLGAEHEPVDTAIIKHSRRGHKQKPSSRARSVHFRADLAHFGGFGPLLGANG